ENLKRIYRILGIAASINEKQQEELWQLDDERSIESRAAWLRVMRIKQKRLGESDYHIRMQERQKKYAESIRSKQKGIYEGHTQGRWQSDVVFVFASLDLAGAKFVYNLTVKNISKSVITNVTTTIVAYPRDCMAISSEYVTTSPILDVDGFITESFIFVPTKDCVEGKIVAIVSFIDHKDNLHTVQLEPYIIRSVCDLLKPFESSTEEFESTFETLVGSCEEITLGWNAAVVLEKAKKVLPLMNFYLIDVQNDSVGNQVFGTIRGFALGKYTGKRVAVVIKVAGEIDAGTCKADVTVHGDDSAMLPTTMTEIADKIDAWICLQCGARLNPDQVMNLEAGGVLTCRYCSHTLSLDLYTRSDKKPKPKATEPSTALGLTGVTSDIPESQGMSRSTTTRMKEIDAKIIEGVSVLRGCEIIGNKFEYKVKIKNDSESVITNVAVTIVAYPMDCLTIVGKSAKVLSRIEVNGFRSPGFSFIPTKDCVEGKIIATVTFIDHKDQIHTLHSKPFVIRSVCDLLKPLESTPIELDAIFEKMKGAEEEFYYEWNPHTLYKKTEKILPARNFYIVDATENTEGGVYTGEIRGYAQGKYTNQRIAVSITITGQPDGEVSKVVVKSLSDDESMLPTTIEELRVDLGSWICLRCGGKLDAETVTKIRSKTPVECEHCGHTMTLDLYRI
ncbi:MAG: hypothetical protein ACTSUB_04130, partial [Candidatus Thorarchaeota archaeon]